VLAGHVIPYDLGSTNDEKSKSELARRNVDFKRIFQVGGIVAPMLGTPTGVYLRNGQVQVPVCKQSGTGSIDQWRTRIFCCATLRREAVRQPMAVISQWARLERFAGWPAAGASCASQNQFRVIYPFPLPARLAASSGATCFHA